MNHADEIRKALEASFPLQRYPLPVGSMEIDLTAPDNMERLISRITEEEFIKDERFPYWAEVWHSAIALGEFIQEHPERVRGRRVHEIGCGLGVPGIVAARLGASLTFSDYEAPARMLAELNFLENAPDQSAEFLALDFREPPERAWPVVLASDVIYEDRFAEPLASCLRRITADDGVILLAEPDREIAIAFFLYMDDFGFRCTKTRKSVQLYSRNVDVSVCVLERA